MLREDLKITDPAAKKKLIDRLARIEGQLRGIEDMITHQEPCGQIAQQVAAARQALNKVFSELIANELSAVEQSAGKFSPEIHARLTSLVKILSKFS
jgi:DNA-binding FrmR family transcriptional regulator